MKIQYMYIYIYAHKQIYSEYVMSDNYKPGISYNAGANEYIVYATVIHNVFSLLNVILN